MVFFYKSTSKDWTFYSRRSRFLAEHVPDVRHRGRGAAHFLASFIAVVTALGAQAQVTTGSEPLHLADKDMHDPLDPGDLS